MFEKHRLHLSDHVCSVEATATKSKTAWGCNRSVSKSGDRCSAYVISIPTNFHDSRTETSFLPSHQCWIYRLTPLTTLNDRLHCRFRHRRVNPTRKIQYPLSSRVPSVSMNPSEMCTPKDGLHLKKQMLCIWWDWKAIIYYELFLFFQVKHCI